MVMKPVSSTGDYQLSFEERISYLYAYVRGENASLEIARDYWNRIAKRALSLKVKKVLVVEDISEAITISEVHQLATELSELPVKDIFVAFVDRFAQHKSTNEFGMLVGGNRGLEIRGFESTDDAEKWLLSR